MDFLRIFIAAFSATNIMTAFSYLLAVSYNRLFKEPVLLNYILDGMNISISGRWQKFKGWLAHYIIGLMFVFAYELIWIYTSVEFGLVSGIVLGIVSGFIGILGWSIIFRLPHKRPDVSLEDYYIQLFFAHILFAGVVVIAYMIYDYDPASRVLRYLEK